MNEKEWQKFLATKPEANHCYYKMRRQCAICTVPISDVSVSGLCAKCVRKNIENLATHNALKRVAKEFLLAQGCKQICEEYKIGYTKWGQGHWVIVDALGTKDGQKIAVECGGSWPAKLSKLAALVSLVYVLPYGEIKPFLWHHGIVICHTCGHIVSQNGRNRKQKPRKGEKTGATVRAVAIEGAPASSIKLNLCELPQTHFTFSNGRSIIKSDKKVKTVMRRFK